MARIRNIAQLRSSLGDDANAYSDEELLKAVSSSTGIPLEKAAVQFGYDTASGPWSERASASIDHYQGSLYGLGETVAEGLKLDGPAKFFGRRRRANEISADISRARSKAGGIPDNWDEVDGFGSAAKYVGGLAIDSAPYVAEALAGGVAGRAVAGAVAGGKALTAAQAGRAAIGGGVVASYPSSVADILDNQREQAGETNLGAAAALGVPYAALNAFGESRIASTMRLPKSGVQALDRLPGVKGALARGGTTAARIGAEEGLSETGQEVMNQFGRMAVDPRAELMSPDARQRYLDSFIGGAALGGVLGGGLGGWRRSGPVADPSPMAADPEADTRPNPPQDLLQITHQGLNPLYVFPDGSVGTEEDAFKYRYSDRRRPSPYDSAVDAAPRPTGDIGESVPFEPIDMLTARVGDGQLRVLDTTTAEEQTQPAGGLNFPEERGVPPAVALPSGRIGSTDTEGLSLAGEDIVRRAQLQPQDAPPQLQTEAPKETDNQQPVKPNAPADQNGIDRLEQTKARVQAAHEAIGRAQEAGMTSEKQQAGFWRAEQLAQDGKLDESKLTQVIALLTQSMYGKAGQIMDAAAAGTGHEDLLAKYKAIDKAIAEMDKHEAAMSAAVDEIERLKDDPKATTAQIARAESKRKAAKAKHDAAFEQVQQLKGEPETAADLPATVAPVAVSNVAAPTMAESKPTATAKQLKEQSGRAAKLKRYKALLACLTR